MGVPPTLTSYFYSEQAHGLKQTCSLGGENTGLQGIQGWLAVCPPACLASFLADLCWCLGSCLNPGPQTHFALYLPGLGLSVASAAAGHNSHDPWLPPLDHVDDLVENAQALDGAATDVAHGHLPELAPVPGCADHFT